jgi:CheY-like chemotaxis protein
MRANGSKSLGSRTGFSDSVWGTCEPATPGAPLRLIALSGYADADLRDACLAAGFDAYLVKPGEIPELERLIGGDGADSDASKH